MLLVIVTTFVVGYLAICALVFVKQRALLFPAPTERARPAGRSVTVDVPGGTFLLWRDVGAASRVVVHFHGNGEQVGHLGWLAEEYAARGNSFAAIEYPGYAQAPGFPSESTLVEAGRAGLEHLTGSLGVARDRLVLSGQSVGTGVAVTLAAQGWGRRLVLITPYTSLPDVAARVFPWLPVRLLMHDRFDSAALATSLSLPTFVVHGTADEVIAFDLGQALSAKIPGSRLLAVPGAHHNDVWSAPGVLSEVLRFVGESP